MKKNKYIYYLTTQNESYADFCDEILNNISYKEVLNYGFQFLTDIPTIFGNYSCLNKTTKEVLVYKKLSYLIDDYLFNINEKEYEDAIINNKKELDERFDNLIEGYEFVVFKKNIITNKFSKVQKNEIINCHIQSLKISINQIIEGNSELNYDINMFSEKNYNTLKTEDFQLLLNKIESLIEKEHAFLTFAGYNGSYTICVMKENGYIHKEFKNNKILKKEKPSANGFFYENGVGNLKKFLSKGGCFGINLRIVLTEGNLNEKKEKGELIMYKVYGMFLSLINDEFILKQISAKEVLDSHTTDFSPEKEVIYCGEEKDDFICGFDLI